MAPARPTFFRATQLRAPAQVVHPLMGPMYWAAADVLASLPELAQSGPNLPSPNELRAQIGQQLATMAERARNAGILPEDVTEAQYALVALIDEILARASGWAGQGEWRMRPLQLARFNENTAGENFFRRLTMLEGQPHRAHVLQIYFLCMAMGYQGRYVVTGGEGLAAIYERVGAQVSRSLWADTISPHGEPRERRGLLQTEAPLVRLGLGAFALALVVFVTLRVALGLEVRSVTRPMHAYAKSSLPTPAVSSASSASSASGKSAGSNSPGSSDTPRKR
jgi:type VI secretion system protein ImpK